MLVNKNFNNEATCPGPDAQSGSITLHSFGKGLCCLGFLCPLKPQVLSPCLYQACRRFENGNEPFCWQGLLGTGSCVLPHGTKCHFSGL